MTTHRKLAAILSADAAGYSRLMADDEAATLRSLNDARTQFRERIEAHGGRLIDTAGDSVLAEFPSAVEAVDCTVEIQHEHLCGWNERRADRADERLREADLRTGAKRHTREEIELRVEPVRSPVLVRDPREIENEDGRQEAAQPAQRVVEHLGQCHLRVRERCRRQLGGLAAASWASERQSVSRTDEMISTDGYHKLQWLSPGAQ